MQEFVTETRPTGREQERTSDRSQEVRDPNLWSNSGLQCVSAQLAPVPQCLRGESFWLHLCLQAEPWPHPGVECKSYPLPSRWLAPTRVCWKSRSVTLALACPPQVSYQQLSGASLASYFLQVMNAWCLNDARSVANCSIVHIVHLVSDVKVSPAGTGNYESGQTGSGYGSQTGSGYGGQGATAQRGVGNTAGQAINDSVSGPVSSVDQGGSRGTGTHTTTGHTGVQQSNTAAQGPVGPSGAHQLSAACFCSYRYWRCQLHSHAASSNNPPCLQAPQAAAVARSLDHDAFGISLA